MLEHMLSELEHEAEQLEHARVTLLANDEQNQEQEQEDVDDERWERDEASSTETETETETESVSRLDDDSLATICFKSLRVGLELTKNMQSVSQALADERRRRTAQASHVMALERRCLEAEMRCEQLEERHEEVVGQLDGMRDAMIATEEAVHRLTQELLRMRRFDAARQSPATPSRRLILRHDHHENVLGREDRVLKTMNPSAVEDQWVAQEPRRRRRPNDTEGDKENQTPRQVSFALPADDD
ncbi:hypothetical protein PINS_up005325 [Pythium insidiosum]|nr:hypothetical protein PINS_up005325 [Pythium insidiosum]